MNAKNAAAMARYGTIKFTCGYWVGVVVVFDVNIGAMVLLLAASRHGTAVARDNGT
jgi:hypothetical protein